MDGQEQPQVTNDKENKSAGRIVFITSPQMDPSEQYTDIEYRIFGKEMPFDIYSVIFSLLIAAGGIMGYVSKGSIPSLGAGLGFAAILLLGTYIEAKYKNHYLLFVATAVLGGYMGYRAIESSKFLPGGLVAAASLLMLIRYAYLMNLRYQKRKL